MTRYAILLLLFCVSTAVLPQDGVSTPDSVTPAVRAQIAHVKDLINAQRELITAYDRRYEQRFVAQEKAVTDALIALEKATEQALIAAKEAVRTAQIASEKRLDSVNEFREQLRDQAETFMRAGEANGKFETLTANVNRLQERIDRAEGSRAGADSLWQYFVAFIGLFAVFAGLFLTMRRIRIAEQPSHLDRSNGTVT